MTVTSPTAVIVAVPTLASAVPSTSASATLPRPLRIPPPAARDLANPTASPVDVTATLFASITTSSPMCASTMPRTSAREITTPMATAPTAAPSVSTLVVHLPSALTRMSPVA